MKFDRCLDAGSGDGRVTKNLLLDLFETVDMFDRCPKAVKILRELKKVKRKIGYIDRSDMQNYNFKVKYDAIFMTWIVGYLDDDELIEFLKKAARNLKSNCLRRSRL